MWIEAGVFIHGLKDRDCEPWKDPFGNGRVRRNVVDVQSGNPRFDHREGDLNLLNAGLSLILYHDGSPVANLNT